MMRDGRYIEVCRAWLHGDDDTAAALDGRVRHLLFWRAEVMMADPDPDMIAAQINAQHYLADSIREHHIEGLVERMEPLAFFSESPDPEPDQPRLVRMAMVERAPVDVWRMAQYDAGATWLLACAWYLYDSIDHVRRATPHLVLGVRMDQRPLQIAHIERLLDSAEKALACIQIASEEPLDQYKWLVAYTALEQVQASLGRNDREQILAGQSYEKGFERALFRRWVIRRVDKLRQAKQRAGEGAA